jgi:hypothetical protein
MHRQPENISERAVVVQNPQHAARAALGRIITAAHVALAACHVDFAHYAPPDPFGRTLNHIPDKFMAQHAREVLITLDQFQVCVADSTQPQADQGLAGIGLRAWTLIYPQRPIEYHRACVARHNLPLSIADRVRIIRPLNDDCEETKPMKKRPLLLPLLLMLVLPLLLAACAQKTQLRFSNETACGTATIALTNMATSNIKEYTVDQGKETTIEVKADTEYRYEVTYLRQSSGLVCDTKRVTTQVSKGQTLSIKLASVLDPELEQATLEATPESGQDG